MNISPPAIHTLAVLCALSGIILAVVFASHMREREPLYLTDRPGTTIASVGAMLSPRSPDGPSTSVHQPNSLIGLLDPWDTKDQAKVKLQNKRFGLNPRTGVVEVQHDEDSKSDIKDVVSSTPQMSNQGAPLLYDLPAFPSRTSLKK